jgi:hypothetical protein
MRRWYSNRATTWTESFLVLIAACLMLLAGNVWLNRQAENPPSVLSGLRGKTVIILRLPSRTGDVQQIWIGEDGIAVRGNIASGSRRNVQLTSLQWQAVNNLREAWCVSYPQFSVSRNAEVYYEIGLRCGAPSDLTFAQVQIPADQLPAPLVAVLTHVPAP